MTRLQYTSTLAGMGIACAFGAVRFVAAQSLGDFVLAAALTVSELGVIKMIESKAKANESKIEECELYDKKRRQAESLVQAAREDLAYRQQLMDDQECGRDEIEREFERDHALSDLKTLTAIAINAARDGYYAGISANRSDLGGLGQAVA